MDKSVILKSLRINYFVALVAALMVPISFELGFIEKGVLVNILSSTGMYVAQVVVIMLTVVLVPLAIKGFTRSLEKARNLPEGDVLKVFSKKSIQRISLLFIVMVVNGFAYYGLDYSEALYCGLFGLGSMIYSFPTKMVLEQYLCDKEK